MAVTRLGGFTTQIADDLASLRPLVVAATFDSSRTVGASRRVSATLTAFAGLEDALRDCADTTELAQRVELLRASAEAVLDKALSASIIDARVQRDAAFKLFGLLPEVLAVSDANRIVAGNLGLGLRVAEVPNGSARPIGSLKPLPTPTPPPTPRPTPRPSAPPRAATGSTGSGLAWNATTKITAAAYKADVTSTYTSAMQKANYDMQVAGFQPPGLTPEEAAGRMEYARILAAVDIADAIGDHYRFMNANKPARCFQDAYLADIKVGDEFLAAARRIYDDPLGDHDLKSAFSKRDGFLGRLNGYFSNCR